MKESTMFDSSKEYYSDVKHWDIYVEPFMIKEDGDVLGFDVLGLKHAFYFIGHYVVAVPKDSKFLKPSPYYDLQYYCFKMPVNGANNDNFVAVRKAVLPFSAKYESSVHTDSIMHDYIQFEFNRIKDSIVEKIQNNIAKEDGLFYSNSESLDLFEKGGNNCSDYFPYLIEKYSCDDIRILKGITEEDVVETYKSNVFILRLNTLTTMAIQTQGRGSWGCNVSNGSTSYSALSQNSFVIYPNQLFLIHGDVAEPVEINDQLVNPNDKLLLLFPRGIKVNDILTSNKAKILSYFKPESILYSYYQSRNDKFPAVTIDDITWQRYDDYAHYFYHPDYWTGQNIGFEYFEEDFADPSSDIQKTVMRKIQEKRQLDIELNELLDGDRRNVIEEIF